MREQAPLITRAEASAQAELRQAVKELKSFCRRLEVLHAALPVSADEALMLVGEEDMDLSTEIRSVVECVLNDSLKPAIRDLEAVAVYGHFPGEDTEN